MQAEDLDFAAACTRAEGWQSETRELFAWALGFDPGGCVVAVSEEGRAGICVATSYGATGFIGELIVLPRFRGRGLGRRLLDEAGDYLVRRGARAVLLDGVPRAVPLYERTGFRKVCRSLRFSGLLPAGVVADTRPAAAADLPAIAALDLRVFGADRRHFLAQRLAAHGELCRVRTRGDRIVGYLLGRGWDAGWQGGPWIQEPELDEPARLLLSVAAAAGGRPVALGVLEANAAVAALVRALPLHERPDPPGRMARGELAPGDCGCGDAGWPAWQITIGSAAKG